MKLVDANVLLYAVNSDAERHDASRTWLDTSLSGDDTVAFAWIALLAFVRLATKRGLFANPLPVDEALDRVDAWLASPSAVVVRPGPDHAGLLRRLLDEAGTGGNLVSDAHLAALAIAHRCDVVSFDRDFDRFGGVTRVEPS
ncbi:MAG: TA system VapC family ribonuclease toxin [Actinomycetota bacterium]